MISTTRLKRVALHMVDKVDILTEFKSEEDSPQQEK